MNRKNRRLTLRRLLIRLFLVIALTGSAAVMVPKTAHAETVAVTAEQGKDIMANPTSAKTEGSSFVLIAILILFVVIVAVIISVVASVTGTAAAVADEEGED